MKQVQEILGVIVFMLAGIFVTSSIACAQENEESGRKLALK
jgi:hypothetical protein